ncbi:MAG: tetratricopeptide repeat protein [Labilithrix sp.]|nr:tetratricopeptide repeat protein [Labilithrix sp.]
MSRALFRKSYAAAFAASALVVACSGWDPSRPFEREAPQVREAIGHLDGGDAQSANDLLQEYLSTGSCKEGNIGTPPRVREKSNGTFDLGLALFKLAEKYGRRFGDEEIDAGPVDEVLKQQRAEQVDCALRLVRAVGADAAQPIELRARAKYLEGNLLFLNANYEEAVRAYDGALELAPGMGDAGPIAIGDAARAYAPDPVGRDAAYNRAIALRRIEDKKDAGSDAASDASSNDASDKNDGGGDKNDDKDGGEKSGDAGGNKDGGGKDSGARDSGGNPDDNEPPKPQPQDEKPEKPDPQAPPPPSRQNQDERMLDQLENAPTIQQEDARKRAQRRRVRGTSDK